MQQDHREACYHRSVETAEKYGIDPVIWTHVIGKRSPTLKRIMVAKALCREMLRERSSWEIKERKAKEPTSQLGQIIDIAAQCHPDSYIDRLRSVVEISLETHGIFESASLCGSFSPKLMVEIYSQYFNYVYEAAEADGRAFEGLPVPVSSVREWFRSAKSYMIFWGYFDSTCSRYHVESMNPRFWNWRYDEEGPPRSNELIGRMQDSILYITTIIDAFVRTDRWTWLPGQTSPESGKESSQ